jgi:hypothetical protein
MTHQTTPRIATPIASKNDQADVSETIPSTVDQANAILSNDSTDRSARVARQASTHIRADARRKHGLIKKRLTRGLVYAGAIVIAALLSSPAIAAGWANSPNASKVAGVPVFTITPWQWPAEFGFFSSPDRPLTGAPAGREIILAPQLMNAVNRILQGEQPRTKTARLAWYTFVHEYTHSLGWDHPIGELSTTFYNQIRKQYPVIAQRAHLDPSYAKWLKNQVFGP